MSDGVKEAANAPVGETPFFGVRRAVLTLVLCGATVLLGESGLGMIPVPNSTNNATILHIPVIIGAALGGPLVGMLTGLAFGGFSWIDPAAPIFRYPLVAVLPRVLIGLVAWMAFISLKDWSFRVAAVLAGVLGSFSNTVGVLFIAVTLGYFPASSVVPVIPQAMMEALLAGIGTLLAVQAWYFFRNRRDNVRNPDQPADSGPEPPG